jgi:hypothetical protein
MPVKAQAALDFLMTYGWALLVMGLIIAGLFALGIFDVGSFVGTRASGFVQVTPVGWRVTPAGALTVMFKNNAGTDIVVTQVNATLGTTTLTNSTAVTIMNGEQTGTLALGNFGTRSGSYTISVKIAYNDSATGFSYTDAGTISGRVT